MTNHPEQPSCEACDHVREHGWLGHGRPARSHCKDCHRDWNSLQEGHCARCCRHFANVSAFDAHLTRHGCTDPQQLARRDGRPRMRRKESRFGETWALVNYRQLPDFSEM
jgi:hypothetical protein